MKPDDTVITQQAGVSPLIAGTGKSEVHLLVVGTADRGLCGGFNSSIARESRRLIRALRDQGKTVKVLCIGRKGRDQLRREFGSLIIDTLEDVSRPRPSFEKSEAIAQRIMSMLEAGEFDVCTMVYAEFKSAMTQIVRTQQLVPFAPAADEQVIETSGPSASYEYEPEEQEILEALLPRNLAVQIYKALLENSASEHGARMTAMDSATRNAGDMIDRLSLVYNRTRQATITKELIEIVSAKEAM